MNGISRTQLEKITSSHRRHIDCVKWLLPFHLGGTYAYLANDLTVGAMVATGFALLTIIRR